MNSDVTPRVSMVVPTTGRPGGILRMLDSLILHAPAELLQITELVVFLNVVPNDKIDITEITDYLELHGHYFLRIRYIRADKFHLTAEESACAAAAHAIGEFLWIVGDRRIFLPEGLAQLARYIQEPSAPCAYFNSVWQSRDGITAAVGSTHLTNVTTKVSYKQFVQATGCNFMATAFGSWIFERRFLNLEDWQKIITSCGPHFSHVTALLYRMHDADVLCHSTFLCVAEAKLYHAGVVNEWDQYAKISKTFRFYAWTFGLVRQFQFLIDRGVYSYADLRRSMCCEAGLLSRQIDEIFNHFVSQIRHGWLRDDQKMSVAEFNEVIEFLTKVCPERAVSIGLIRKFYQNSLKRWPKGFGKEYIALRDSFSIDGGAIPLVTLIVGKFGDKTVRLHPRGYLISDTDDRVNFLMGYRFTDPPAQAPYWTILDDDGLGRLMLEVGVNAVGHPYNPPVTVSVPSRRRSLAALLLRRSPDWFFRIVYFCFNFAR